MAAALTVQVTLVELVAGLVEAGGEAEDRGGIAVSTGLAVDAACEEALGDHAASAVVAQMIAGVVAPRRIGDIHQGCGMSAGLVHKEYWSCPRYSAQRDSTHPTCLILNLLRRRLYQDSIMLALIIAVQYPPLCLNNSK